MKQIGDVIAAKRKEIGLSQADLASRLLNYDIHIKNAAVSSWEKNVNTPTAYQLLALCEILGIRDIYSEFIECVDNGILSGLNEAGKQRVIEYIKLLKQSPEFIEKDDKPQKNVQFYRKMPVALLPASAGLGELVGDEMFEEVEVNEGVPDVADFGVRLSGNSMEPTFHDGQIVWIEKKDVVQPGEIGLFFLDGMTYCKRLIKDGKKTYLASENKEYEPIQIHSNSDIKVYGVVVSEYKGRIKK